MAQRKKKSGITKKQQTFCNAYVKTGGDLKASAEAAGYHPTGVYRLLKDPQIWEAINRHGDGSLKVMNPDQLQAWWTDVLLDERMGKKHRLKASELLGKSHGMFDRKHRKPGKTESIEELLQQVEQIQRIQNAVVEAARDK